MTLRRIILLVIAVILLGAAIFAYKREATGTTTGPTCSPTQYQCPCATGYYCLQRGAMCLAPTSACPAQ